MICPLGEPPSFHSGGGDFFCKGVVFERQFEYGWRC